MNNNIQLNRDVLRIIIAYITDPTTLYSLILSSKWFKKELQCRFQKYFEPVRVTGMYGYLQLTKPCIYHPIYQSTINESNGPLIISKSGGYKIMEDLKLNRRFPVGIELKSVNEKPVNVWIEGNNKTLKCCGGSVSNGKTFTFIRCRMNKIMSQMSKI